MGVHCARVSILHFGLFYESLCRGSDGVGGSGFFYSC